MSRRFRIVAAALAVLAVFAGGGCSIPRWPVHGTLTSPYGLRGFWPELHRGVDVSVPDGTPVQAMEGGVVEFAGQMSGYGNVVVLRHGTNLETLYGHLSQIRVRQGERVEGRQVIALSGHSGNATGPHLHFEVRRWGRQEDPVPLLGGGPR
ncbi:MAG TPA: M23 family metallopeptidase [Longimicrobiales bacterium]|nr:M23 family metallopeptidase [Longimicrobiales bacterium]